jgi:uncharacterized protein YciI
MYALALIRYRRPIDEVVAQQDAHRAYLRRLKDEGVLVAAGPLDPRFGGALLLHVPDEASEADLDAVRNGDPYWQAGVAQYELLRWNVVTGRADLDRALMPSAEAGRESTVAAGDAPSAEAGVAETSVAGEREFAVLRQFDSSIEAELCRTALEAAGLYAAVWDEDSQLGPAAQGVRLVVREADLAQANDILAQAATAPSGDSEP